ncbi:MAG: DUF4105 domain-containing protein [Prevotella sp.]|nr:DUF4105 domain-containing protein [Prevotella sp.]
MDSVEFGLLTCSPHEEIYSLYGHTAIHFRNPKTGEDWVANYGVFDFHKPYFILRFVFGLTDYNLEVIPYRYFEGEYKHFGSMVTEQILNLTNDEKAALYQAIYNNAQPQNREYRYNFYYDNCTTRARDIIERNIQGNIRYTPRADYTPTYREMVREKTRNHPWATFGDDLLLGIKSDMQPDMRGQEFLPENMMTDFAQAQIVGTDGIIRPLVKEQRILVKPGVQIIEEDFPLTPTECALILLGISILVIVAEFKKKHTYRWWDVTLILLQSAIGCVLFVMIFSQHPTTSINLQILLFNPLPLLFIYNVARGRRTQYWNWLAVMTLLFYLGNIWQSYAEGMSILALCLLLRFWTNTKYAKK